MVERRRAGEELPPLEVELVHEGGDVDRSPGDERGTQATHPVDAAVPTGPPSGQDERASRWSRRRVATAAVSLVLVGAVVAVATVAERRAIDERRAHLASVPGILQGDLGRPLEDVWTVDGAWQGVFRTPGDRLFAWSWDGGATGIDPSDGTVLWSIEPEREQGRWCQPLGMEYEVLTASDGMSVGFSPYSRPRTMLCASDGPLQTYDLETGGPLQTLDVVAFDAVDGTPDDVVAVVVADRMLEVVRWSARTGEIRWAARPGVEVDSLPAEWAWGVDASEEAVALYGEDVRVFDLQDGAPLDEVEAPMYGPESVLSVLADGATVELEWGPTGQVLVVRETDGTARHRFTGRALPPRLDDGTLEGLLLLVDPSDGLSLRDAASAEVLWERDDVDGDRALVAVDGRLVVEGGGVTRALAVEDGRTLWEHRTTTLGLASPVTDGTHLVVAERPREVRMTELVARRLDDGSEVWREPMPEGPQFFQVSGPLVLRQTQQGLIASRPAG